MSDWKSKYGIDGESGTPRRSLRGNANARRREGAEPATILCAVIIAAALGAASGLWLSSQWASAAASADSIALSTDASSLVSPTDIRAERSESHAPQSETENVSTGANETTEASEASASTGNVEPSPTSHDNVEPSPAETRTPSRLATQDDGDDAEATIRATGREKPSEKADKDHGARTAEPRAAFARSQGGQCRLSMSAGALVIRGGGGATLTLSLGGAGGAVTASTPDWSNIAVLSESGPFRNEAQRYTVKSVSGRPGVYSVSFRSPCGSRTIPVTVTGIQK